MNNDFINIGKHVLGRELTEIELTLAGALLSENLSKEVLIWKLVRQTSKIPYFIEHASYSGKVKNLYKGSPEGVKARQVNAKQNHANLDKAINDLFDSAEKPGWNWTNERITDYVSPLQNVYKSSTILKRVKTLAAGHRKARKEELASKYPKR